MAMWHRLLGVGVLAASAGAAFFVLAPGTEEWILIVLSLAVGIGACQAVCGLSLSEAWGVLSRRTPFRVRIVPYLSFFTGFIPAVMLISAHVDRLEVAELRQNGVVTKAKVTEVYSVKKRRGGTTHHVKVKFKDSTGKMQEIDEQVDADEFNAIDESDTVEVIYLPKIPRVLDILADKADWELYQKQPPA